jgi:hypothetical protein
MKAAKEWLNKQNSKDNADERIRVEEERIQVEKSKVRTKEDRIMLTNTSGLPEFQREYLCIWQMEIFESLRMK